MDFERKKAFILDIQQRECLYNRHSKDYRDRDVVSENWVTIAGRFGCTVHECKTIWRSLRDRFAKEWKICKTFQSGDPTGIKQSGKKVWKEPKWAFYELMLFMSDHVINSYKTLVKTSVLKSEPAESADSGEDYDLPALDSVASSVNQSDVDMQSPEEQKEDISYEATSSQVCSTARSRWKKKTKSLDSQLFEMETKKTAFLETSLEEYQSEVPDSDGDRMFMLSLLPTIRTLDPAVKSLFKMEVQKILHNFAFGAQVVTQPQ